MKKLTFLLLLGLGIWNDTHAQDSIPQRGERVRDPNADTCTFRVRFYSEASGPDLQGLESMDRILKEEFKHMNYRILYWGREGERDYCFQLNDVQLVEKQAFIGRVKSLLKGYRVEYIER